MSGATGPRIELTGKSTSAVAAFAALEKQINSYGIALKTITKVSETTNAQGEITRRNVQGLTQGNKKFNATLAATDKGFRVQTASMGLTAAKMSDVEKRTEMLRNSVRGLTRILTIQVFHRALAGLLETMKTGFNDIIEFQKAIGEIKTIDVQNMGFNEWKDQLRELSDAFGIDVIDQAEGAYQALSNQVVDASESMDFLVTANELAIVGMTSVSDAVDVLSSAINAYGLDVKDAELISAKFFKTIENGRVRLPEMAQSLGRIAVPAAQVGVSLDELLASISSLTVQGVKYSEAATLIRNVIQKLIRPTKAMTAFLSEMGFASGEAAIKVLGFAGFLQKLEEHAQGSTDILGELFGRVRSITGAMGFAGDKLNRFNEILADLKEPVKDFRDAIDESFATVGKQIETQMQEIKNSLSIDIAQPFITAMFKLGNAGNSAADKLKFLAKAVAVLAIATIPKLVVSIGLGIAALTKWAFAIKLAGTATLAWNPVLLGIGTALAVLTGAYFVFSEDVKGYNEKIARSIDANLIEATKRAQAAFGELASSAEQAGDRIEKGLLRELAALTKGTKESGPSTEEFTKTLGGLGQEADEVGKLMELFDFDPDKFKLTEYGEKLKGVVGTMGKLVGGLQEANRELMAFGKTKAEQAVELRSRIEKLAKDAGTRGRKTSMVRNAGPGPFGEIGGTTPVEQIRGGRNQGKQAIADINEIVRLTGELRKLDPSRENLELEIRAKRAQLDLVREQTKHTRRRSGIQEFGLKSRTQKTFEGVTGPGKQSAELQERLEKIGAIKDKQEQLRVIQARIVALKGRSSQLSKTILETKQKIAAAEGVNVNARNKKVYALQREIAELRANERIIKKNIPRQKQLGNTGNVKEAEVALIDTAKKIKLLEAEIVKHKEAVKAASEEGLRPLREELIKSKDALGETTAEMSALKAGLESIPVQAEGAAKGLAAVSSQATLAAQALAALAAASGSKKKAVPFNAPPEHQQRGKGRAFGGVNFKPMGSDNIPAMLGAGEMVMPTSATRRFFPQLMAMKNARTMSNGGMANPNTYHVNVTESRGAQATAQAVVREIRRGVRRGTMSF